MKKQISIVLWILLYGTLQAQDSGHYFHFNAGGGWHNMSYNINKGTQQGKAGYTLNAAYSYFFSQQWGLQTGVGIQNFSAQSTLNFLSESLETDMDGDPYIFKTNFQNSLEKQNSFNIDIPLTGQYRHFFNKKVGLLATVGAKISIPISTNYETTGGQFVTTGYYDRWNVELSEIPQHGFATCSNTFKGNYTLKPAYLAVIEIGGLFKMSEKLDLYAGAYFNYGLNNILTPYSKYIFQADGVYNGVLASNQTTELTPVSAGLKVGFYWKLKKAKIAPEMVSVIPDMQFIKQAPVPINTMVQAKLDTLAVLKPTDTIIVAKPIDSIKPIIEIVEKSIIPITQPRDTRVQEMEEAFNEAKQIATTVRINFAISSSRIGDSENEKVKALSEILNANPGMCLQIIGHTDNTGSYKTNLKYGLKRALAMKQKFILNGVSISQLKAKSKSYKFPLIPNTTVENRAKNRRVELTISKMKR